MIKYHKNYLNYQAKSTFKRCIRLEIMNEIKHNDMVDVIFIQTGKKREFTRPEQEINRRFLNQYRTHLELLIIILFFAIGIICGFIGFFEHLEFDLNLENFIQVTFNVLQLFVFQFSFAAPVPWALDIARFVCPIALYLFAILAFLKIFQDKVKLIMLSIKKNHVVICGLDKKVIQLISDFKDNKENTVVIETNKNNVNILKAENLGAIVLIGEYSDFFMLTKARIHRAKYLIAFTNDDYKNIEVGINTNRILKEICPQKSKKKAKIKCFIHIRDTDLRNTEFLLDPHPGFLLKTFNIYENSTRYLFLSKAIDPILKIWSERKQVHLLIVGFREMGEAVLLQAAKLGVFPEGEKLKFTILDQNIHVQKDNFMYRYPNIEEICDLTFKELELDNLLEFKKKIQIDEAQQNVTAIFLCLDDKSLEIQYKDCLISELEYEKIPIYIHIDDNEEVIKLPTNHPIFAFGLVENSSNREFIVNEKLDDLARLIHDDFRSKFKEMPDWDKLSNFKKKSNRLQADHNLIKLRTINRRIAHFKGKTPRDFKFTDGELELLARMEHNRWCAEQYIYIKDLTKNELIDLKPFDELQDIEKKKDYNAVEKIPSLLAVKKIEIL